MSKPVGAEAEAIVSHLRACAKTLGFSGLRIAGVDLSAIEPQVNAWLAAGFYGSMDYMARHGNKRTRPAELVEGTVRVISVHMPYLAADTPDHWREINFHPAHSTTAIISRYALGRDYHKVLRNRLQRLAEQLSKYIQPLGCRVFVDSAPVMEVALAEQAGLGWRGKNTLLLSRETGSMVFLGEIYIDYPLPIDPPVNNHCGQCTRCLSVCPTGAIVAPYVVDARRCLSYLTIESDAAIPIHFRRAMGQRIYGCDDCQAICPWNRYALRSDLADFSTRDVWRNTNTDLLSLWSWTEEEFLHHTTGSAIRRIGYERWMRNIAVALGNASRDSEDHTAIQTALRHRLGHISLLVDEHIQWALAESK